jgi:peroxiredoxin Q/BCP
LAQVREDDPECVQRDAEVVVVGPDTPSAFKDYWRRQDLPFVGLADPDHVVANGYGQEVKLLKFGRLPAMMIVDKRGMVRYRHYAASMQNIPPNSQILALLDALNE